MLRYGASANVVFYVGNVFLAKVPSNIPYGVAGRNVMRFYLF